MCRLARCCGSGAIKYSSRDTRIKPDWKTHTHKAWEISKNYRFLPDKNFILQLRLNFLYFFFVNFKWHRLQCLALTELYRVAEAVFSTDSHPFCTNHTFHPRIHPDRPHLNLKPPLHPNIRQMCTTRTAVQRRRCLI